MAFDLFNLVAKLTLDSSEYEQGINGLDKTLGGAAKVGGAAVAAATGAVIAFGAKSVETGRDFDKAMAQVAATSGKTVEQIGDLREFAKEMGATTQFSATQAAQALNFMALAGYDAETSMKMLPNVLNLAAAGDIDLALASDMVTDAQTALGLSIEDTTTMVDQMAKASSISNTSVAQLGDALLTVGGNAKTVKGGTAELSAVLGAMADNGIKGSEAGTHLRNILLAMNPTTDAAAAAWEELGVQAYDADGNLRNLEDVFMELGDAMDGMSDQKRTQLLSDMFNKTDLAAVNALLSTQSTRWDELNTSIDGAAGAAGKMADTQLDNLEGDVVKMQSAFEGVQIAVSDGLTPTLRTLVQGATDGLSKITTKLTEYLGKEETQKKLQRISTAVGKLIDKVLQNLDKIFDVGITVISGVMDAVGFLVENIDKIVPVLKMIAGAWVALQGLKIVSSIATVISAITPLIGVISSIGPVIAGLMNPVTLVVAGIAAAAIAIIKNWDKIKAAWGKAKEFFGNVWKGIQGAFQSVGTWISQKFKAAWDGVKNAWKGAVSWFSDIGKKILGVFTNLPGQMLQAGRNLMDGLKNGIVEKAKGVVDKAKEVGGWIIGGVNKIFGNASPSKEFKKIGGYLMQGLAIGIEDNMGLVDDAMSGLEDLAFAEAPTSDLDTETTTTAFGGGEVVTVPRQQESKQLTVILQLDRMQLGRAVYQLNNAETQRVGVQLAGGFA